MSQEKFDPSLLKILVVGLEAMGQSALRHLFVDSQWVEASYDLEKLMDNTITPEPVVIACGPPPEGVQLIEVAQMLRMQYQNAQIYYITNIRTGFDRKIFQKNGFTEAFLLPLDQTTLVDTVKEELSKASKGAIRAYKEVRIIDLEANAKLNFDTYVYLPANRKHIHYTSPGDDLTPEQVKRLQKSSQGSMHVTADQIQEFYKYTATALSKIENNSGMSETERRHKMQGAIRNLMAGIFNDSAQEATLEKGKSVVSDCQEIVKSYVVQKDAKNNWFEKLMSATGSTTGNYNHAGNVATFAALFSMATGLGKPEDLALAGLLHDMGLADIPFEVQQKPESERTADEQKAYQKHVEKTLDLIKFRKMILPEIVVKAISQHHERFSGTGYPKGTPGARICVEASVLAMADQFDYLTMTQEGKVRMKPLDAIHKIMDECAKDTSKAQFDVEFVKKFLTVFAEEPAPAAVK